MEISFFPNRPYRAGVKEKAQRLKSFLMVGIPTLIFIYFLGVPFLWVWLLNSMSESRDEPSPTMGKVIEAGFRPPVWVAERFRPYYEYWRLLDRQFGPAMLPEWEEFQRGRN